MPMQRSQWLLLCVLFASAARAYAAGELMVHPTRIVFDGNTRSAQIDVINSGTEPMTYRISIIRRRMNDTGDFVAVDQPAAGEQFADEMIRYSPRQVVLQPGVAQAVRLQLRKPATLEQGEYRSHLLFQALPPTADSSSSVPRSSSESHGTPGTSEELRGTPRNPEEPAVDIRLTAVYSVSIPVIVRHGATTATVAIRDLALQRNGKDAAATMTIARTGTRSIYGDLTVYHRSGRGAERVVGRANGVAVYVPNATRRVLLPLPALANGVPAGELRVTFAERPEQAGRLQAEAQVTVP